jgi:hypothetical protein
VIDFDDPTIVEIVINMIFDLGVDYEYIRRRHQFQMILWRFSLLQPTSLGKMFVLSFEVTHGMHSIPEIPNSFSFTILLEPTVSFASTHAILQMFSV